MLAAYAEALERGAYAGPLARTLGRVWEHTIGRAVVRKLTWPSHVRVVAVGGATLGGSGKTPLAMACAADLASRGVSVALVGHAYRATPRRARVVRGDDALDEVGDEALLAAQALGPSGVSVVVAPKRSDAVALAASIADVLVLDGVGQAAPVRASLALLAVDAEEPWGRAAALPPRGDLRAPVRSLVGACDMIVAVGDDGQSPNPSWAHHARTTLHGVFLRGELLGWDEVAQLRLGFLSALARPDRVLRALERRGVRVRAVLRAPDHGPLSPELLERMRGRLKRTAGFDHVDLWLATAKCALHIPAAGAAVGVISSTCVLPSALRECLDRTLVRQ
ncbi:MAG: tetraacyldisaccharide 4'-kinase [Polyangiaceae bacterium]